jgi:hypothetical protein
MAQDTGVTLLRALRTLSGMWSWIMTGEMRTSSKSVLLAHTAWYTGSCLFNTCLMMQ